MEITRYKLRDRGRLFFIVFALAPNIQAIFETCSTTLDLPAMLAFPVT